MNRKIVVFVVGLLALGALEFGLLGASAAGFGGGGKDRLPPLAERNDRRTPVASPTPALPRGADSIELHRPDPDAIPCDGAHRSSLSVEVRDSHGKPAKDGTNVSFGVYNGSADPPNAQTRRGTASTSIVLYSDAYSSRPNVDVRSGDMETAIRVRCIPNSGCPLSPPPNASPPCGPTPFPCNPSPGAGPMSPPCEVVPPPSPPICAPNQTSPPCVPPSPPPCDPSPISPPCVPPSPPQCDPNVPSPPCPPPPATSGVGGQIYIGTPEFINGKIRVPVNTTASTDPFVGFNAHLLWDGTLASIVDITADATLGDIFGAAPSFCARSRADEPPDLNGTSGILLGCIALDGTQTSGAGHLADFWLTPKAGGCMPLHLMPYDTADVAAAVAGTYTIDSAVSAPQSNTYGPDVYVNTANGNDCGSVAGCISFSDPTVCGPTATPTPQPTSTPPGSDAQTATATVLRTSTPAATSSRVAVTSTATPGQRRR